MPAYSIDEAKKAIKVNGFYCIEDAEIGLCFQEAAATQVPEESLNNFSSEAGFNFCRTNVLLNDRIQEILEAFGTPILFEYGRIAEDKGHLYRMRNGGKDTSVLAVHIWKCDSGATYYGGSHTKNVFTTRSGKRLFESPLARVRGAGCTEEPVTHPQGGFVIIDARLSVQYTQNDAIVASFATPEEAQKHLKLVPPQDKSEELEGLNISIARYH